MNDTDLAYVCPVCSGNCRLFDVVDFNKSCEEARGKFLPLSGSPIYYALCEQCGFCFSPEISSWTPADFEARIYNAGYLAVDPDYAEARPRSNANALLSLFGTIPESIRHLDFGGGCGMLRDILLNSGWNSASYDPFVDRTCDPGSIGRFDLITAFEVFEHVPDVPKLMSTLRLLLAPGGMILLSTLLSDGHIQPGNRLTWWYASPRNGHISLFSRKSLARLAADHGFHVGSFSDGFHAMLTELPDWAARVLHIQPNSSPE